MFLTRQFPIRSLSLVLALVATLMTGSTRAHAAAAAGAVTAKNLKQKITSAKTATDHKAIAAYYRAEAAKAQAKVTEHQEMAEVYRKAGFGTVSKTPNAPGTIEHCNHLVKTYQSLAESLEMMAKEHEAMAANVK
ncbi:MAG: hypothetical protein AB1898_11420 [Acidobacteriota bacterium]